MGFGKDTYRQLGMVDVLGPVEGRLEQNGFVISERDNKIIPVNPWHGTPEPSWLNQRMCPDRKCYRWFDIYFHLYRFISRNCFHCFKIVCRPKTLKDLIAIYELQQRQIKDQSFIACKCGIERRNRHTHKGLYAAFWYTPLGGGLEESRMWHRKVSKQVREAVGIHYHPILKRGCTEMEDLYGPSNKWNYPESMHLYEDLLDVTWVIPVLLKPEPSIVRTSTVQRWIRWARMWGDPTYERFSREEDFGDVDTIRYDGEKVELGELPNRSTCVMEEIDVCAAKEARDLQKGTQPSALVRLPSD